ncbi:MAG TPA: hypothetical protein VFV58_35320 [Blastocatellia bacterium]|jgi:hypothetical protein|nr:hypothetical protein [Blastocatellia bacterium]
MSKNNKPDSAPRPMPAPQLPNIPISPDDPFQSDPDLLPPIAQAPDPDPAPSGQPPGNRAGQAPRPDDPDDPGTDQEDMRLAQTRPGLK